MLKADSGKVLEMALFFIDRGWFVLPCLPKSKEPHFGLIRKAYLDATNDPELVKFWVKMDPNMNLGINAIRSGLVILDIDFRNGGILMDEMLPTFSVKTGDGYHLYYRDNYQGQYRSALADGIDIKYKGYVVTAPSIHPTGSIYEIKNDVNPSDLPEAIGDLICRPMW